MVSADTNLFLYALNSDSQRHEAAARFLAGAGRDDPFTVCELVLVELYMLLRNPAVLARPLDGKGAADVCARFRSNPRWQYVDYEREVSESLWRWAGDTTSGFRRIIDARLALTLLHHGVTDFATANEKDFREFGFRRVWNPLD